ncbi:MAG: FAD binding domain-containing protein [Candidatus Flexifilum sp.]
MIRAYHRPNTLEEALHLLARPGVHTAVLPGFDARLDDTAEEVVDLQALAGLRAIIVDGAAVTLGALTRLQALVDDPALPDWLRETARREDVSTFRHMRTLADLLLRPEADSALLAALLVCDAAVTVQSLAGAREAALSDYLAERGDGLPTELRLRVDGAFAEARVGRTPGDRPIVAAAARRAADGTIRLALCGVAPTPVRVEPGAVEALDPPGDFRGSSTYRKEMAALLSQRVLSQVGG